MKKGSRVLFGRYIQSDKKDAKPEKIEWVVLEYDAEHRKALLLSRYGLDTKPYHMKQQDVTWETCSLRNWLNGAFLKDLAFTAEERRVILLTDVDNSKEQCFAGYPADGGNNTQDQVFLLSCAEAEHYLGETFDTPKAAVCVSPTAYAKARGAKTAENCFSLMAAYMQAQEKKKADNKQKAAEASGWWWLRSPGYFQDSAAIVNNDGALHRDDVSAPSGCVRPALWVDMSFSKLFREEE